MKNNFTISHRIQRFELLFFNIIQFSINVKVQYVRTTNTILLLGETDDNL